MSNYHSDKIIFQSDYNSDIHELFIWNLIESD